MFGIRLGLLTSCFYGSGILSSWCIELLIRLFVVLCLVKLRENRIEVMFLWVRVFGFLLWIFSSVL